MGMPLPIENAVVVGEEDLIMPTGQCLGHCNVPGAGRTAVRRKRNMLHVVVRQRIAPRACVVHHVDPGKRR